MQTTVFGKLPEAVQQYLNRYDKVHSVKMSRITYGDYPNLEQYNGKVLIADNLNNVTKLEEYIINCREVAKDSLESLSGNVIKAYKKMDSNYDAFIIFHSPESDKSLIYRF